MKTKITALLSLIWNIIMLILLMMGIIGGIGTYLFVVYLNYYEKDTFVHLNTVLNCDSPSWIGEGLQCMTNDGYKPCRILACISEN